MRVALSSPPRILGVLACPLGILLRTHRRLRHFNVPDTLISTENEYFPESTNQEKENAYPDALEFVLPPPVPAEIDRNSIDEYLASESLR